MVHPTNAHCFERASFLSASIIFHISSPFEWYKHFLTGFVPPQHPQLQAIYFEGRSLLSVVRLTELVFASALVGAGTATIGVEIFFSYDRWQPGTANRTVRSRTIPRIGPLLICVTFMYLVYSFSTVHSNGYSRAFARFIDFSAFVLAISYG